MSDERVEGVMSARLHKLFEGLDEVQARKAFEELLDEYTYAVYGLPIIPEMEKLKKQPNATCVTIQPIASSRAILVSHYGFELVSETQHPKGGKQIILRERTRKESDRMNYHDRTGL
jgi:hypothetical protein